MFKRYPILQPLLIALTLGLAPFSPQPHILGKIKWLKGGGVGMQALDYFDTLLHGLPWLWLFYFLVNQLIRLLKNHNFFKFKI